MVVNRSEEEGALMEPYELIGRLHKLELVRKLCHQKHTHEFKLYFGQMPVLNYVSDNPGCTQVEIANCLQVSPASIALSTKRLQKSGYLIKEVDKDNLRCKRLYLTDEGKRVRELAHEKMDLLDASMFEGVSQEEMQQLAVLLDRITMNLTGESENIVNGEVFRSLHRQIEKVEHEKKDED